MYDATSLVIVSVPPHGGIGSSPLSDTGTPAGGPVGVGFRAVRLEDLMAWLSVAADHELRTDVLLQLIAESHHDPRRDALESSVFVGFLDCRKHADHPPVCQEQVDTGRIGRQQFHAKGVVEFPLAFESGRDSAVRGHEGFTPPAACGLPPGPFADVLPPLPRASVMAAAFVTLGKRKQDRGSRGGGRPSASGAVGRGFKSLRARHILLGFPRGACWADPATVASL